MSATTAFTRKSISLEADLAQRLESQAKTEGRSLSNLVNFRLRNLMISTRTPKKKARAAA